MILYTYIILYAYHLYVYHLCVISYIAQELVGQMILCWFEEPLGSRLNHALSMFRYNCHFIITITIASILIDFSTIQQTRQSRMRINMATNNENNQLWNQPLIAITILNQNPATLQKSPFTHQPFQQKRWSRSKPSASTAIALCDRESHPWSMALLVVRKWWQHPQINSNHLRWLCLRKFLWMLKFDEFD